MGFVAQVLRHTAACTAHAICGIAILADTDQVDTCMATNAAQHQFRTILAFKLRCRNCCFHRRFGRIAQHGLRQVGIAHQDDEHAIIIGAGCKGDRPNLAVGNCRRLHTRSSLTILCHGGHTGCGEDEGEQMTAHR